MKIYFLYTLFFCLDKPHFFINLKSKFNTLEVKYYCED